MYDNAALQILVESGRLTADSLETMLLRKADWHDGAGLSFLLNHGADPNRMIRWPWTALHHAVRRDNSLANIDALLDHGADPLLHSRADGRSAAAIAARRGRGDVLASLERRGIPLGLERVDRLLAACARSDTAAVEDLAARELRSVRRSAPRRRNVPGGVCWQRQRRRRAVSSGSWIPADARYSGDAYFDVPPGSLALHVAAWRAAHSTVALLVARGSPVDVTDANGRTPLMLAVRACVDSHWISRRSPQSVTALLAAGASLSGVQYPSGYDEVDTLLGPRIAAGS